MSTQIEIATTILSALLTGGFIIFFVENQHIERDVIDRYHAVMDPYYHKLSYYLKFVYFLNERIRYADLNVEYLNDLKLIIDKLAKSGSLLYTSGKDVAYMSSEKLENLNKDINNVRYYYEKVWFVKRNVSIDTTNISIFSDSLINEVLSELSGKFAKQDIDKNLLPRVSADFYSEIWVPVEFVTNEYEKWQQGCTYSKRLLLTSIGFVMAVLVIAMLLGNYICYVYITVLTIICCIAFGFTLIKLNSLMKLSHRIFK